MNKRNIFTWFLVIIVISCFAYLFYYYAMAGKSSKDFGNLSEIKENQKDPVSVYETIPTNEDEELIVLDQYKTLLDKNKNLIGWLKIDDTNIDYPVMKSVNGKGSFYLNHNFDQKEDRNGTLFMEDQCDPIAPSDNLIIYGHNMKSGEMFGQLDHYKSESFYQKHKQIKFDTIYKEGVYEVMYAFPSRIYSEAEIVFKYYQFITVNSEQEFESGLKEMAQLSLYDTGVKAEYGDQLLTLSTCDYEEEDGRFVVVCKRIN
ncbi:MAG: class B sortase [Lachnospiraceae bacterium]|nr:class B sortase [Lachnospiraceae bacterium]